MVLRVSGFFFKSIAQAMILLRSETWVVTPYMGKAMGGFHNQVVRWFMGRLSQRTQDRKFTYNLAAIAREDSGFLTMEKYIRWHQNTDAQYIATRSLLDLCEGSERAPGARVGTQWWNQAGLNLERDREVSEVATERDREEE